MSDPHGVRWARHMTRNEPDYTKWHYTADAKFTACGQIIPIALEVTFLPETSDVSRIDCRRCLKAMGGLTIAEADAKARLKPIMALT